MDIHFPYEFIGFGAVDDQFHYDFIGSAAMDDQCPMNSLGLGPWIATVPIKT